MTIVNIAGEYFSLVAVNKMPGLNNNDEGSPDCIELIKIHFEKNKSLFLKLKSGVNKITTNELEAALGIIYSNQKGKAEYLFTSKRLMTICNDIPWLFIKRRLEKECLLIDESAQRPLLKKGGTTRMVSIRHP